MLGVIRVASRCRVPDVVRTLLFRRDFFGDQFSAMLQRALRGKDSEWSIGERELFAAFTAKLEACHF